MKGSPGLVSKHTGNGFSEVDAGECEQGCDRDVSALYHPSRAAGGTRDLTGTPGA